MHRHLYAKPRAHRVLGLGAILNFSGPRLTFIVGFLALEIGIDY